jgi:anti-anti-sigma factor
MQIQRSTQQGCVVLTVAGPLDSAAAPRLQRAILKQLAEHPPAIICNLSQVEEIDPVCAGVFTSIRHPALSWPGTALILCGTRPAVEEVLLQLKVATRLAMYSSLDQALANAHARPPRVEERLALGPVPTAARAVRAFVREVCDRWGLQELVEPAALVASELVTNAVIYAGTSAELRIELRGSRLYVSVHGQDPNLTRVLTAEEGTDRGLSLQIMDQAASTWGVRQDRAGGKTIWCALDLPAEHAATPDSPQLLASARTATTAVGTDGQESGRAEAMRPPAPDPMWAKLAPPALGAGLIQRARLQSLLQTGMQAKLCLLAGPAGSGKTTLLGQWRAASGGGRMAWISVGEGDNDPTRFWTGVIEALRTVEPTVGAAALAALHGPRVDLDRVVLPLLLGELGAVDPPLVLVLDNYQVVTDAACLHTLGWFLKQLPADIHVVLATRVDPPLQLAGMRALGELAELRAAELQFTVEEAAALLNGPLGLGLAAEDVERLVERTEGWAAGLVLVGLALRGRQDPSGFIAAFHGDDRHVTDLLVAEVLARQPEHLRRFLVQTSVLERLSGPLCDAVLETEGSAELLEELEASNLFLVPLDDQGQWYRSQQLFTELLRLELTYREPALVPVLHRQAAAWHRQAGNLEEASYHATAAASSPAPRR